MKKIKLKESDLRRIVRRVINEQACSTVPGSGLGGPCTDPGCTGVMVGVHGCDGQGGGAFCHPDPCVQEGHMFHVSGVGGWLGGLINNKDVHVTLVCRTGNEPGCQNMSACNPSGGVNISPLQDPSCTCSSCDTHGPGPCISTPGCSGTSNPPTGGCDAAAWSGYNTWISNWTNGGAFNSQNPKQPCNHICKQINTWTNNLTNAGTTQANQLNCKVDEGNNQSQIHGCNC